MRIYTGRGRLMEPAMIDVLRSSMAEGDRDHIVVVPKQLTLQTERSLLSALSLKGSFRLQVLSPERLCARVFEAAGQPEGARVDERGRVMLVRAAVHGVDDRLRLYRGAAERRGAPAGKNIENKSEKTDKPVRQSAAKAAAGQGLFFAGTACA